MVIDTSAFLAILQDEPDRTSFTKAITAAAVRRTSAATFLEASIVLESRHGADGVQLLDLLIESAGIEVVAVDFAQSQSSRAGRLPTLGKGGTRPDSTTATVSPTRSPASSGNRCSVRATTSRRQISPCDSGDVPLTVEN